MRQASLLRFVVFTFGGHGGFCGTETFNTEDTEDTVDGTEVCLRKRLHESASKNVLCAYLCDLCVFCVERLRALLLPLSPPGSGYIVPEVDAQIMPVRSLFISRQNLDFMIQDCNLRKPEEACGLLVGAFEDAVAANVSDVMPVRNESMSPYRFSIDPIVMFKAQKKAEEHDETIIGVYHSHPAGAEPSHLDINYMEGTSYVWVIVEHCGKVKAFVYENGVKEVEIKKMEEAAAITSRGSV
jgi:proteasome lid subunit RPN8/RPN11